MIKLKKISQKINEILSKKKRDPGFQKLIPVPMPTPDFESMDNRCFCYVLQESMCSQ